MDIPSYLDERQTTEEAIRRRMLERIPDDIDKTEGSYIWDSIAPVAIELVFAAMMAQEVLGLSFAQTTTGEYLDMRCGEHGVYRNPAVPANGSITFSGQAGTIIPIGTQVATPTDEQTGIQSVFFHTVEEGILGADGTAEIVIEAEVGGKHTVVPSKAITILATPIPGVSGLVNMLPTADGFDIESDQELLERYLFKVRNPATSGNKNHYILWCMEVAGVGGVSVIPLKNGPGTVDIAVLDQDKNTASAALIELVKKHVAELAPMGATVSIAPAATLAIHIEVKLMLTDGYTLNDVQPVIESNIKTYLSRLIFVKDNDVRYVRICQAILDTPGVYDFSALTVNGGTSNVVIGEQELAVLGTVIVT